MTKHIILGGLFIALIAIAVQFFSGGKSGEAVNVRPVATTNTHSDNSVGTEPTNTTQSETDSTDLSTDGTDSNAPDTTVTSQTMSTRELLIADSISLPLSGSAPTENVKFSIPINEIRQGCFRQDCIPSVDSPEFVSVSEASDILPDDTIGIALSYKGEERFYPFNMLVTREIVNDVVAGDPLLVTYCPLCGTGIVFDRTVDGTVFEFGVSGMLWQSNLLMYNRAAELSDRNLWSQVLGEAVVGNSAGTKLQIISSNIMRFTDWSPANPGGIVLNTGRIGDPYGGDYYGVAQNFAPNFDEANSTLNPSEYVYGVEIDGNFKAYPFATLPTGVTTDTVGGSKVTITKTLAGLVTITDASGATISDVEGFWFSWVAAHPETELWGG